MALGPCTACGSMNVNRGSMTVAALGIEATHPSRQCDDCGERWAMANECAEADMTIASALADRHPNAKAFRFMRLAVGLTTEGCAAICGVRPETVSRWENGRRRMNPTAWNLMVAHVRERLTSRDDAETIATLRAEVAQLNAALRSRTKRNAARCLLCGDTIESVHTHDFRTCSCGNVSVDGGRAYRKRVFRGEPGTTWIDEPGDALADLGDAVARRLLEEG